jgi:hydrogenase maturation protease
MAEMALSERYWPHILMKVRGGKGHFVTAIGLKIAEILKKDIKNKTATIKSGSIDGLAMLDEIIGFDKVILVDSINTKSGVPGDVYKIELDSVTSNSSLAASHTIDFITALRMGKKFGYKMPEKIYVYAVEIKDNNTFSEKCTEQVSASIPEVVKRIIDEVSE